MDRKETREKLTSDVFRELQEMFDSPTASPEEAREFVRQAEAEAEARRVGYDDDLVVRTLKDVARAFDHVRSLRNHSRALRDRISEIAKERGL
jgi:hypothetical protein